eukprot:TRINITY_DN5182_c0_g1_i1.p1 TRINITY_DN5182_c0_g1~~TRINITY_DN5182_c0_g1_i1.p1  ORF type:complete len:335 (+),score=44.87 TRINITY_DN5182_c0_g1_i1:75-1079(+)
MSDTVFTREEIEKHNNEQDAWIIIDGYVHDVTNFARMHPGGSSILKNKLGKDATESFSNPSIHSHSASAMELLEKLRIGTVYVPDQKAESSRVFVKKNQDIDLDKGLVTQLASLGDKYQKTIHDIGIANRLELRLFDNPLLEKFTVCPLWLVPAVWMPFVFWGFYKAAMSGLPYPLILIPLYILIGGLTWGLIEYTLHRYLFHLETQSFIMNALHFMIHGQHHVNPMNPNRLVFPPVPAAPIIILTYLLITAIYPVYSMGLAHWTGGLLGYVLYDLTHYYLHHGTPSRNPLKMLKTHHVIHHFKNEKANFAISFFALPYDWVFGTWVVDKDKKC